MDLLGLLALKRTTHTSGSSARTASKTVSLGTTAALAAITSISCLKSLAYRETHKAVSTR